MKDIEIIRNATPDSAEILVTFLDEDGFPRNVLLRRTVTEILDTKDDDVVAIEALKVYVGKEEIERGEKEIPPFKVKQAEVKDEGAAIQPRQ